MLPSCFSFVKINWLWITINCIVWKKSLIINCINFLITLMEINISFLSETACCKRRTTRDRNSNGFTENVCSSRYHSLDEITDPHIVREVSILRLINAKEIVWKGISLSSHRNRKIVYISYWWSLINRVIRQFRPWLMCVLLDAYDARAIPSRWNSPTSNCVGTVSLFTPGLKKNRIMQIITGIGREKVATFGVEKRVSRRKENGIE